MIGEILQPAFEPEEVRALWRQLESTIPEEKARAKKAGKQIAKELHDEGGHKFEGGGQKMLSIDLSTYIRVQQQCGQGCWNDQAFVDRFLQDNPQYRAPGYYPKPQVELKFFK